jgi:hypothetical protein
MLDECPGKQKFSRNKTFWQEFANAGNQMKIRTKAPAIRSWHILAWVTASLILVVTSANAAVIVAENFGGTGAALNGTTADTFNAAITAAGGSSTWAAAANFLDNGVVTLATRQAAYLNLGSYINDTRGTAAGLFDLTMTISPTAGAWISLGFAGENNPNTLKDFTNSGQAGTATTGIGTIIYRNTGELDMFGGPKNGGVVDGPNGNTGNRTLTVSLDLTPTGGFNGTSNFGTVSWFDSVLGNVGLLGDIPTSSYKYTSAQDFGSILISETASSSGTISGLSLSQIPEPSYTIALLGLGGLGVILRRRRS